MKKILFILLLFSAYSSSSQIYNSSVIGVNCYTDSGSVSLEIIEWQTKSMKYKRCFILKVYENQKYFFLF